MSLVIRDARLITLAGARPRRGPGLDELAVIERGWLAIEGDRITALGAGEPDPSRGGRIIEALGRILLPGFVDAHTHACWAGDRLDEWEQRRGGASYLEILRAGGGIMSTVRAVRRASPELLADQLRERLAVLVSGGTTTVEVKSGYGLTTADELKMLRVIREVGEESEATVVPTACIGHAIDPDAPGGAEAFVERTIEETLPAVHAEFPAIAVDAYCEEGAWSREQVIRLFDRAAALGHPLRVHADQFHELGLTEWAIETGLSSVDHLEATSPSVLKRLAASPVFGVMLPAAVLHAGEPAADGRAFVDAGGALAIATNWNPGSSPCSSMALVIALAVRSLGLSPREAIAAATLNPAELLGLPDRGALVAGSRADLVLMRHRDERELAHELGGNPAEIVICGGRVVRGS